MIISGKLENEKAPTINHPEFIEEMQNISKIPSIQAIYPTGAGLTQKYLQILKIKFLKN